MIWVIGKFFIGAIPFETLTNNFKTKYYASNKTFMEMFPTPLNIKNRVVVIG